MNEQVQKDEIIEIDLKRLLDAVLNKAWVVALVSILCAVLTFFGTLYLITPLYESTAMFYVNNSNISVGGASVSISSSDITASKSLVDTYIVILNTRETLNDVIDYAGVNRTYAEVKDMLEASAVNDTEIFQVVVTSPYPNEAEQIANAAAYILPKRISSIVEGTSAKIVDSAVVPSKPSSPNYITNTIIGFMLGFLMSVGVIVVRELFDVTLRNAEDVAKSCKHPLLAKIPDMANSTKKGYGYGYGYGRYYSSKKKQQSIPAEEKHRLIGDGISFAAAEAYKLLRTKIQFSFVDDKDCHIIGVSSAMAGEGKSMTSANLAYSLAQLEKKVLLIDCDMRRPSLADKLSIKKYPGMSDFLTGQTTIERITQQLGSGFGEASLQVITAGRNPPNPMELLSSDKMARAINKLRSSYDYIVLDLPPVGEVSDAMAAAKLADGILLVACQDYGTSVALTNAINQFEFIETKILGIVLNRATDRKRGYGYRYHYKRYYKQYGYYSKYDSYESSYEEAMLKTQAEQPRKKR